MKAVLMAKEFWLNSQFSIARFYGGINVDGKIYKIIGEKQDLLQEDFIALYKQLGRESFISILKDNQSADDKTLKEIMKMSVIKRKAALKEKQERFNKRQTILDL